MKLPPLRFYFLFAFFTLLFLFYPGDSPYFHIFSYYRPIFAHNDKKKEIRINPVPYSLNMYYPAISSQGAYVCDLASFTPVFEVNSHDGLFPASTAKIITALVSFDIYRPDRVITVKNIVSEGQIMGLVEGENITVENLLYGVLVHSGNDAAYALAEEYGLVEFVALMNKKAAEIGMKDSHFTTPAGLDDNNPSTSAYDLALASRELLRNPYLGRMASIKEITLSDVDFKYFHRLANVNKLLGEIQGIGGLKTGYTESAGENLVSLYKKDGHQWLIVLMKSLDRFEDTRTMVKWIDENVRFEVYD